MIVMQLNICTLWEILDESTRVTPVAMSSIVEYSSLLCEVEVWQLICLCWRACEENRILIVDYFVFIFKNIGHLYLIAYEPIILFSIKLMKMFFNIIFYFHIRFFVSLFLYRQQFGTLLLFPVFDCSNVILVKI